MKKRIIQGVITITVSSAIIKLIGFIFRIYLSNKIGAEGMGLYQLVISIYALGATFACSGISIAVSKLVAENPKNARRVLSHALLVSLATGVATGLIVYFNAEGLSINFLKDARTLIPIRTIAFCFPAISLFACISGYFYGLNEAKEPMGGQIVEQLARITFVLIYIDFAMLRGLEHTVIYATAGIVFGEFISLIYILLKYKFGSESNISAVGKKNYLLKILAISVPVSLTGYAGSIIRSFESVLTPARFVVFGLTHQEAISILGAVKGMVMPVITFPSAILGAVATVILPAISHAKASNNLRKIDYSISKVLKLNFILSILVTILFFGFGEQISALLYKSHNVSYLLRALAFTCPFIYLSIVMGSILNGLGKQVQCMGISIFEGALRLAAIYTLIPRFGLLGYIGATLGAGLIGTALNLAVMLRNTSIRFDFKLWIAVPVISGILAYFGASLFTAFYLNIIVYTATYFILLWLLGTIKNKDLAFAWKNIFPGL